MDFSLIEALATLAQESSDAVPPPPGFASLLLPMGVIFLLYIFLIDRPKRKQQMERENSMTALKKGDKVVTIGGICGKVDHVDKTSGRVTLTVGKGMTLEFVRAAIDRIDKPQAEGKQAEGKQAAANEEAAG